MSSTWLPNLTNRITFVMVDAIYTEVAGLGGGYTLEVSKNGGAFVGSAGVKAEISDGWYSYVATASEADTDGPVSIRVTGAGAIQQNLVYEVRDWSSIILSAAGLVAIANAVWTFATRTLTAGGVTAIAVAVWINSFRSLVHPITELRLAQAGNYIAILRGDTMDMDLSRLGNITGFDNIWFTVKDDKDLIDTGAILQIDEATGLLVINGAAAAVAANGSIVVTDAAQGNITITLAAVEAQKLTLIGRANYDIQWIDAAGVVATLVIGRASVIGDLTRRIT